MIFFVLGAQPELSIAELKAVLPVSYRPVFVSESVIIVDALERSLGELQERLAGVVKVGRVVGELAVWNKTESADLIARLARGAAGKNKIRFGLSVYDLGDKKQTRFLERDLDGLGLEVKKRLKETGRPVRYVKGKEPRLSSAIVETNGLLSSGGEFVLLVSETKILIGQTEAIQNFKAWSDRDFGRPARDSKSGMLPPKLARMMINLAGIEPHGASVLDPFCGSGTVLMEAALMGCEPITGSDFSEKAIRDSRKNIAWLQSHFRGISEGVKAPVKLLVSSATDLPAMQPMTVDLLITEVFLGSPRVKAVDPQEIRRLESELLPLYRESFKSLARVLKPTSRAVVAFPAYKTKMGKWHRLPLKPLLEHVGYKIIDIYLYYREDQLVARDIYVLTLK
jgi:tRNA (guanine10-N2)-dimethyltransferase